MAAASPLLPAERNAILNGGALALSFGAPHLQAAPSSQAETRPAEATIKLAAGESQIALWHQMEGEFGYQAEDVDLTTAQALVDPAESESAAPLVDTGVPLDEAISDGLVTATVDDWQEVDAPQALPTDTPFYGSGTLV